MKALTVWQPWATFIVDGIKLYETRHWPTDYRGELAIHAAKRWVVDQQITLAALCDRFPRDIGAEYARKKLPFGCVLAIVELVNVHRVENIRDEIESMELRLGNYAEGRFAWEMKLLRLPPNPIPVRGQQGLWEWNPKGEWR